MYHVHDSLHNLHIFTHQDPRTEGYQGEPQENAQIISPPDLHLWRDGAERPQVVFAVSNTHPSHFREFACPEDAGKEGYRVISGTWLIFGHWSEYLDFLQSSQKAS